MEERPTKIDEIRHEINNFHGQGIEVDVRVLEDAKEQGELDNDNDNEEVDNG